MKLGTICGLGACLALLTLGGLSCGSDGDQLGVDNVSPTGSVGGLVVDASNLQPLEGVQVSIIAGGKQYPPAAPAVTDASGYFSVDEVPSGGVIISLTPADGAAFRGVQISSVLPNAAGEFPLANATLSLGPIGLLPVTDQNSALTLQLVTADGAPAPANVMAQVRSHVEWINFQGETPEARGLMVVEGKTDNSGRLALPGLPNFAAITGLVGANGISDALTLKVPPYDLNKDGVYEFAGMEKSFSAGLLYGTMPTVVLDSANTAGSMAVLASNIGPLAGKPGPSMLPAATGPIFVTYSLPLVKDRTQIMIYDEFGNAVASTPKPTVSGNVLTITLAGLKEGAEYNISIRAYGERDGLLVASTVGAAFFTPVPASPVTAVIKQAPNGGFRFEFSRPIGPGIPGKHLTGDDAMIYIDADLNGSGTVGDSLSEKGANNTEFGLLSLEPTPPGSAGHSGLTTIWYAPPLPTGADGLPLPPGTGLSLRFSHTMTPVIDASGSLVNDINVQLP